MKNKFVIAGAAFVLIIITFLAFGGEDPSPNNVSDDSQISRDKLKKLAKSNSGENNDIDQTKPGAIKPSPTYRTDGASQNNPGQNNTGGSTGVVTSRPQVNGSGSGPGSKSPDSKTPGSKTPGRADPIDENTGKIVAKPKIVVKQAQPLLIGGLQWKVLSTTTSIDVSHEKEKESAKGKFAIIELEVKNTSQKKINIDTEWIFAVDNNWTYYINDIYAETLLLSQGKEALTGLDVEPGKTVKGLTIFDIPKDAKTFSLSIFDMDIMTYDFGNIEVTL